MEAIQTLDKIISLCVDGRERYRHAAGNVSEKSLEQFFTQRSLDRDCDADELRNEARRLGVELEETGTWSGAAERVAMDASVIMSKGDSGVVDWCREEDAGAACEYEKALAKPLSPATHAILERQLKELRATILKLDHILEMYGGARS